MWTGKEEVLKTLSLVIEKAPHCIVHNSSRKIYSDSCSDSEGLMFILMPEDDYQANGSHVVLTAQEVIRGSPIAAVHASSTRLQQIYCDHMCPAAQSQSCVQEMKSVCFVPNACKGWRLSWRGLLTLLLQEAGGQGTAGREYRVRMSASLSSLPWSHFYNCGESPPVLMQSWLQMCPSLFRFAGMAPTAILEIVESFLCAFCCAGPTDKPNFGSDWEPTRILLEQEKATLLLEVSTSQDSSAQAIEQEMRAKSDEAKLKEVHEKAASRSKFNMFGGRYGESGTLPSNRTKRSREQNDVVIQDGRISEEKSEDEVVAEQRDENVFRSSLDPAIRQHFLLTLSRCCPPVQVVYDSSINSENGTQSLMHRVWLELGGRLLPLFTSWLLNLVRTEVWSIRRAALLLLTSLMNWLQPTMGLKETNEVVDVIAQTVQTLAIGASEMKYSQVRLAAAQGLIRLLEVLCNPVSESSLFASPLVLFDSSSLATVREDLSNKLQDLLRVLASDPSPAVLTCYSEANNIWTRYQALKKATTKSIECENAQGDM